MRLHRLIAILLLIESRGRMKAKELAIALETSVRSIYRDIDVLAEAGIPVVTTPGPSGGIYLMEGYTVNLKELHGEDVINLYLTGMGIYSGGQTESGLKLKNALLKLEKTLPTSYQSDIRIARTRFYFDDTPWWTERVSIPCLETLRLVVWRSRKIGIQYRKVDGACSSRRLHPYGLVVKQGDWYLIAYCEEIRQIRTFKCERILVVELLEDEFEIPSEFSLEHYWNTQEVVFKQACLAEEHYPVVIRVSKENAKVLNNLETIQSTSDGNDLILTVNMDGYEAACRDVLELISYVEIIEPALLRQFVKEQINRIQQLYW